MAEYGREIPCARAAEDGRIHNKSSLAGLLLSLATGCAVATAACQDRQQGEEFYQPGIRIGSGLLQKTGVARFDGIGEITDIAQSRPKDGDQPQTVIAGILAYTVIDSTLKQIQPMVSFGLPPQGPDTSLIDAAPARRILDVDGDGEIDFMGLPESWAGRLQRHSLNGKEIWVYPRRRDPSTLPAIDSSAFGDVHGDGKLEFLISFNATDDVQLIDSSGHLIWSQTWSQGSGCQLFLDINRDGRDEMLYIDGEALWARDAEGVVLSRIEPPEEGRFEEGYFNGLETVRSFGNPPRDWILVGHYVKKGYYAGQNYRLVACDAKTMGPGVTWEEIELHRERGFVGFSDVPGLAGARIDAIKMQAPVAGYSWTRLRLRVMDVAWNVVYDEILAAADEVVGAEGACVFLSPNGTNAAQLLVAYGDALWAYTFAR
jgi:hypothetical protein